MRSMFFSGKILCSKYKSPIPKGIKKYSRKFARTNGVWIKVV